MGASVNIEVLHRGRFIRCPDASARQVSTNAWEVRIPRASDVHQRTRREPELEAWDGAVFSIDGVEMQPGTGSGSDAGAVLVTVLDLG